MTKKKCNSHDLQEEVWLKKASSYYMQSCRQNDEERKKERKRKQSLQAIKGGKFKKSSVNSNYGKMHCKIGRIQLK